MDIIIINEVVKIVVKNEQNRKNIIIILLE
jgi:hypothetical protein